MPFSQSQEGDGRVKGGWARYIEAKFTFERWER